MKSVWAAEEVGGWGVESLYNDAALFHSSTHKCLHANERQFVTFSSM